MISTYNDILYGSVRTVAMISDVPGVTHGFSMYSSDNQEVDFAFLTRDLSQVHLTNEQVATDSPVSTYVFPAPADATTAWHEYRVDWQADHTAFFIDGELILNITENVPSQPGYWIWNNWSSGNAWTHGPPEKDAVLKIQSIDAYYNRQAVAAVAATNPNWCGAMNTTSSSTTSATSSSATSTKSASPTPVSGGGPVAAFPFGGSSPFVAATPSNPGFYLQSNSSGSSNGNFAAVSAGASGQVTFAGNKTSASKFTIDGSGNLVEQSPTSGYAANLNFNINVQKVDFDELGLSSNYGYLNCTKQNSAVNCGVNGVSYSAATCGDDGYLYFAQTIPDSCTAVTLVTVSS